MSISKKVGLALILSTSVDGLILPRNFRCPRAFGRDAQCRNVFGSDEIPSLPRTTRYQEARSWESSALYLSSVQADEFIGASTKNKKTPDEAEDKLSPTTSLPPAALTSSSSSTTSIESKESLSPSFTPFQQSLRSLPFVTAAAYLYDPKPLDDIVANIWSVIYDWDVAQYALFEAEVAVFGFFLWIILFSSLHLFLGEERTKASRFDGELPHKPFEWAMPENYHLWFNPTASYLGSIWLYLQVHVKPPLPEIAPSFGVLAVETLFGIWLYDLCFMPIHYLMHNWKLGSVRRVHGYHHRSGTTLNALETVQHSYIDGFLQVFVNIMVQKVSPFGGAKHVMSRLLHNLSVTYLLSEAHSGYRDLPWMSHNIFPEILGGAPRHEAHHHNGRVYYQQYFKYIDDFFGFTEDKGKRNEHETIRRGLELRKQQQKVQEQQQAVASELLNESTRNPGMSSSGVDTVTAYP